MDERANRLLTALAVLLTVAVIALGVGALLIVLLNDDIGTIISGDLLMCVACLLAVPVMHYWIEGR